MSRPTETFENLQLPAAQIDLPIGGLPFARPDAALIEKLGAVSSATASALLHKMGVRQTFIAGPLPRTPGRKVVGPAVTLQFMPKREDVLAAAEAYSFEKTSALWAVFETVQRGDVLMIQAWNDRYTGCVGEMLTTYFKGRGGIGIVVDGCVRDWPGIKEVNVPLWTCGFTPNYASQGPLMPWAYNVPVALSHVLVLPGDIVIADDDGAVVIPARMAEIVAEHTVKHEEWEVFTRMKLAEGGALRKYYPLSEEGWAEYEQWRKE
jgi:regulator of RNase E activity RraA